MTEINTNIACTCKPCTPKFFICKHCGNIIGLIQDGGQIPSCCGETMQELIPNTTDAAQEKHVPVLCVDAVDSKLIHVHIGSAEHPMTDAHYIQWVYLQTEQGGQRKCLCPGQKPQLTFALTAGDKAIAAYAYCNLHGLWLGKAPCEAE